jgi:hypothetical protein
VGHRFFPTKALRRGCDDNWRDFSVFFVQPATNPFSSEKINSVLKLKLLYFKCQRGHLELNQPATKVSAMGEPVATAASF